jgi:hypothetical protein
MAGFLSNSGIDQGGRRLQGAARKADAVGFGFGSASRAGFFFGILAGSLGGNRLKQIERSWQGDRYRSPITSVESAEGSIASFRRMIFSEKSATFRDHALVDRRTD